VCSFAGAVAGVHARWDALDHFVSQAFDADPGSQFAFFGGQLLMMRGIVEASRGDLEAGIASFVEGRARFRAVGGRSGITTFQALLAELLARGGRVADAAEFAAGARRQTDETGEAWNEVTVCIAEAVVADARDDVARAAERFRVAVATASAQGTGALGQRAERVAAELGVALVP
jgi:predicted ATPase